MTARGFYTLFFGVLMLLTALSVGSEGAFLLGCAAIAALLLSLICSLTAFLTLRITQSVDIHDVSRGEKCVHTMTMSVFSFLPIASAMLQVRLPSGRKNEYLLKTHPHRPTYSENSFSCSHVGVFSVGVTQASVSDCFSLFRFTRSIRAPLAQVTVFPCPLEVEPLTFSSGEGESSAIERAQADPTTPTDTRLWQEGDELKRVHWKLSMRKQQLMVHTYEQNPRPDALVLLDCAEPDVEPFYRASLIDLLTEVCAGVVKVLLDEGHAVRMPLSGSVTREVSGTGSDALAQMLHALATEPFSAPSEFSRVLALSARRMRRTGTTAILTTRLTPRIADDVIALSRMGPHTYFFLVRAGEATPEQQKLMLLLDASGVETVSIDPPLPS